MRNHESGPWTPGSLPRAGPARAGRRSKAPGRRVRSARPGCPAGPSPIKTGRSRAVQSPPALRFLSFHSPSCSAPVAGKTPEAADSVHGFFPRMPDTCEPPPRAGGPVTLNVGGKFYSTTLETLTRFPDSMLGAMFRGPRPALTDSGGNYFIDRDGKVFRHILNFLRFGQLDLPEGYAELSLLRMEADFYQIRPLLEELRRVESERRRQRANAVLHADVDTRDRLLHFNVRCGPQNYELCTCSLQIFTANVFCTDPYFLAVLRRRLGQFGHVDGEHEEGHSGRWADRTTQERESWGFLDPSGNPDALGRGSHNGLSRGAVIAGKETSSWKRQGDDLRGDGNLKICLYNLADEDEDMYEEESDTSFGLSHTGTKTHHHLCLEWAPRPPELPVAEYMKQKLCPLQVGGREIQTAKEFLEEVLKAALAQGFRVDSVFPDPADILNAHSLRFVRH